MNHIYNLADIHLLQPSVVTIGVFDGVHIGHQHLIRQLVAEAHAAGRLAVVLTFFPHPDVVLRNIEGRYYLTTPDERAQLLLDLGVDYVITHPFNEETRMIRAADFVELLLRHLRLSELWVGADFALGYRREGDVPFLTEQGTAKGFRVNVVDMLQAEATGMVISSTLIRRALAEGQVEQVRQWLGRSYQVSGTVIHGQKRGRMIGFPTANMEVWEQQVIPANGIYASWAYYNGVRYMAMTNVGVSPTFGNKDVTVEPYLLDFDREIYGEALTVSFEKYMRPELKFDNLEDLIARIQQDVIEGREFLTTMERTP